MRVVLPISFFFLRVLGVCLAIMMILGSLLPDFGFGSPPNAQLFISRWPMALYLFVWFLLPFFKLRSNVLFCLAFCGLVAASVVLVKSGFSIFASYSSLPTANQPTTLFLIGLSVVTCATQPLAVGLSRILGCTLGDVCRTPDQL